MSNETSKFQFHMQMSFTLIPIQCAISTDCFSCHDTWSRVSELGQFGSSKCSMCSNQLVDLRTFYSENGLLFSYRIHSVTFITKKYCSRMADVLRSTTFIFQLLIDEVTVHITVRKGDRGWQTDPEYGGTDRQCQDSNPEPSRPNATT